MITLDHVTVEYSDTRPLDDLSLQVDAGAATAIMGPSGSGKSTLLRLLAGLQAPTSGTVRIDGTAVRLASWRSASDPRVSLIHQDYRLVPFLTVQQNLLLAAEMRGLVRAERDVVSALDKVALPAGMKDRVPSTLSGGEQQRVAIARSLMAASPVLLADEPTGALDVTNTDRVTEILVDLARSEGLTIVVATHDPSVAERLGHCLHLAAGQVTQIA